MRVAILIILIAAVVIAIACSQIDGTPPCASGEKEYLCDSLCNARICGDFHYELRHDKKVLCGEDDLHAAHRFRILLWREGYQIDKCDISCTPIIESGAGILPGGGSYHEQGETENTAAAGNWEPLPPSDPGNCVP